MYFEGNIRQSQATPNGEKHLHVHQAHGRTTVPLWTNPSLGLWRRNLATRLSSLGKRLTIVDINPMSFVLAHRYFGLPDELPCIVSDFRKFVFDDRAHYDGIAIDVGGPGFRFAEEFDAETCDAIPRPPSTGRPDRYECDGGKTTLIRRPTASRPTSASRELRSWIVDEQFIEDRNAVIACIPEKTLGPRAALDRVMRHSHERWTIRREDCEAEIVPVDCANVEVSGRPTRDVDYGHRARLLPGDGLEANWKLSPLRPSKHRFGKNAVDDPSFGATQSTRPYSKKGRPAPDGSMAAHRHLRRRPRAGFPASRTTRKLARTDMIVAAGGERDLDVDAAILTARADGRSGARTNG